mmetsp:Transcript_36016/g.94669  ORF Transcript_36016/g.94669 Transcript_36016/m.94669 type:complete len:317 (+) Transcript_36016:650-1600(+)
MVLNLIVEKAVHHVVPITTSFKVDRRDDLSQIKSSGIWNTTRFEPVHIISSMIGCNNNKPVNIGKDICQNQVADSIHERRRSKKQARKWHQQEMDQKIGSHNILHEVSEGIPYRILRTQNAIIEKSFQSEGIMWSHLSGHRLSQFSHFGNFQLLISVRCIIEPLPGPHEHPDNGVLAEKRHLKITSEGQIAFNQIWISVLTKPIVMKIVVFDIPCLRKHPVEPLSNPLIQRTCRKATRIEVFGFICTVVSTVPSVMCDSGPAHERPHRQSNNCDRIWRQPHRSKPNSREGIRPEAYLLNVVHVFLTLILFKSLAQV